MGIRKSISVSRNALELTCVHLQLQKISRGYTSDSVKRGRGERKDRGRERGEGKLKRKGGEGREGGSRDGNVGKKGRVHILWDGKLTFAPGVGNPCAATVK